MRTGDERSLTTTVLPLSSPLQAHLPERGGLFMYNGRVRAVTYHCLTAMMPLVLN